MAIVKDITQLLINDLKSKFNSLTCALTKQHTLSLIILFLQCFALSACTTVPKQITQNCQELDWYEIGRQDGSSAKPETARRTIASVCQDSDISLNEAYYNNGFDAGISRHCSKERGFEMGRDGVEFQFNLCPPLMKEEFLASFQRGKRVRDISLQKSLISERLIKVTTQLNTSGVALIKRGLLNGEKLELEQKIKKIDAEIAQINMPNTDSSN